MTVDPFKGGSSATLFVPVGRDAERELCRAEAVRARALVNVAGLALGREDPAGELREVLEALGLIGPQIAAEPVKDPAVPETRETDAGRSGGQPAHVQALTRRRRAAAVARAREILAKVPTQEAPPVDELGVPVLRCRSRLHHKTGANVRVEKNGNRKCVPCREILQARATIREYVAWETA